MSKSTRGRLYVDKDVQRALLWQLFRHWALFVVVLTGMLMALEALEAPHHSLGDFAGALWNRHAPLLVVIASLFPVFAYDSIKLSNRFVGPIVRLRGAMREAVLGKPVSPLQFRKGDFWQDMADNFNALAERLPDGSARTDAKKPARWGNSTELEPVGAAARRDDSREG